jgi:hypothetical protein
MRRFDAERGYVIINRGGSLVLVMADNIFLGGKALIERIVAV